MFCVSCHHQINTYNMSGYTQGTTYSIKYNHVNQIVRSNEIDSILRVIDESMSQYVNNSLLSRINNGEDIQLDSLIHLVLERSIEICHETDGMFDVTVSPLVDDWGFGPNKNGIKKTFSTLSANGSVYYIGCDQIYLKNEKIIKSDSVLIDLDGIAQGFSVDYVSRYLESIGLNDFMVEIGGELRCKGDNMGKKWKIGIDNPNNKREHFVFILQLEDVALATSGSYRNYYYLDSIKISHTMNPKTLLPASNNLISATILHKDCMSADAYATACMSFGLEGSKRFLSENGIDGALIYIENEDTLYYFTSSFLSFLHRSPGSAPQ